MAELLLSSPAAARLRALDTAVALSSLGFPASAEPAFLSETRSVTGRQWFWGGAGDRHPMWTRALGCAGTSSPEGTPGPWPLLWG